MSQTLTRSAALRTTLLTRVATVALAAGAVGLVIAGLPERSRPAAGSMLPVGMGAIPPGVSPEVPTPRTAPPAPATVEPAGIAARLGVLANAPSIPEPSVITDVPEDPTAGPEETFAADAIADRVRFLGLIRLGADRAAFVNVDGRQRFVREGSVVPGPQGQPELGPLRFDRITPDAVTVRDRTEEARIELAPRSGPAVTMADGGVIERLETPSDDAAAAEAMDAAGRTPGVAREMPAAERDRRARMLERQRDGTLSRNPEAQLQTPPIRGMGVSNRRERAPEERRRED